MTYSAAIERLKNNNYRPVSGIEVMPESSCVMYIEVECSPFSVYRTVELIKLILPDFAVMNGGTNSGVGRVIIQSRP